MTRPEKRTKREGTTPPDEPRYEETEAYQQEIASQYTQRVEKFSVAEVARVLALLNFPEVNLDSIRPASVGNVNATYLTPDLVIKMNQKKGEEDYVANKIVSDRLAAEKPVVKVLAYDSFEKTPYEVLVMERAKGDLLLKDIFQLTHEQQIALYRQVLETIKAMFTIRFDDFGLISKHDQYKTYAEYLTQRFKANIDKIRAQRLCNENDLTLVESYFLENVKIFEQDTESVFVHTDLHPGNILHQGDRLTALLDFDYSVKAPKMRVLLSLLGFIDKPSQFVEGTGDFQTYKGKTFYHLLPLLKEELADMFADPQLLEKLNLHFISEGIMWISANWSAEWNKQMIRTIVDAELPKDKKNLQKSYYGKVLSHLEGGAL
ncbi:MAG: phosphotransferase [bacterium]|nr:phosphotransferase [bacterium]